MLMKLSNLTTEKRNRHSMNIDQMSTIDILKVINKEDQKVAPAIEKELDRIEIAIENTYKAMRKGGRLFYVGAGTSGRIGVLDASECPPTFMTTPETVQALMAGGNEAFLRAKEKMEDKEEKGKADLIDRKINECDVVVGITASGLTPYPIGALKYAREIGAYTISLSCNLHSLISKYADSPIEVIVGPEVLTGSTRLKAATAHKMILNMISTTTMIKLGKVYENLMVDVHASNYKLKERAKRIIMEVTDVSYEEATRILKLTNNEVKPAIVMIKGNVSFEKAKQAIEASNGYVRHAIEMIKVKKL